LDRIAIISDIHGNIPALEAVLEDIRQRGIERIYCLGDIAGKGPSAVEAVDLVRENCQVVIKGNWDHFIVKGILGKYSEMMKWNNRLLGKERVAYLDELPLYAEFYMSGRLVRLCHTSPNDLFYRVYPTSTPKARLKLFLPTKTLKAESDVVGYGDIHKAYADYFAGKLLFNTGSVGNPLDITQASYAVMEGVYDSKAIAPFSVMLVRVPYDIGLAVRHAMEIDMPGRQEYIEELRTAIYRDAKGDPW